MDINKLKELIELLHGTDVAEIELKEGETSVRINRQTQIREVVAVPQPVVTVANEQITIGNQAPATPSLPKGHVIKSPMVGTMYIAASPNAKPFVEIGQRVEAGAVLCIVEAMKMLNQIETDHAGVVVARLVENGQPVEFDQPLFVIE